MCLNCHKHTCFGTNCTLLTKPWKMTSLPEHAQPLSIIGKGFTKQLHSILEAVPTGTAKQRKSHAPNNFEYEKFHKSFQK